MTRAEGELPGRRGYYVVADKLRERLARAEAREKAATTVDECEAATREVVEIWEALDAIEREDAEQAERERLHEESVHWGRE